jgi:hypothetical protein
MWADIRGRKMGEGRRVFICIDLDGDSAVTGDTLTDILVKLRSGYSPDMVDDNIKASIDNGDLVFYTAEEIVVDTRTRKTIDDLVVKEL